MTQEQHDRPPTGKAYPQGNVPPAGWNNPPYQPADPSTYRYPANPMGQAPIPHNPTFPLPAPQRKKKMPTWVKVLIWLGVILMLVCGGTFGLLAALSKGASDIEKQIEEGDAAKKAMVTITSCKANPAVDAVEIQLKVVNSSKETLTYGIQINILDKNGTQLGESAAFISDLPAGKTATDKTAASVTSIPKSGVTCQLESVN